MIYQININLLKNKKVGSFIFASHLETECKGKCSNFILITFRVNKISTCEYEYKCCQKVYKFYVTIATCSLCINHTYADVNATIRMFI